MKQGVVKEFNATGWHRRAEDLSKNTLGSSAAAEDERPHLLLHTQRPRPHVDIYENTVMQNRGIL